MRKYDVIWSEPAARDLEDIARYIARDSPVNARRVVKRLRDHAANPGVFPIEGALCPSFSSWVSGAGGNLLSVQNRVSNLWRDRSRGGCFRRPSRCGGTTCRPTSALRWHPDQDERSHICLRQGVFGRIPDIRSSEDALGHHCGSAVLIVPERVAMGSMPD